MSLCLTIWLFYSLTRIFSNSSSMHTGPVRQPSLKISLPWVYLPRLPLNESTARTQSSCGGSRPVQPLGNVLWDAFGPELSKSCQIQRASKNISSGIEWGNLFSDCILLPLLINISCRIQVVSDTLKLPHNICIIGIPEILWMRWSSRGVSKRIGRYQRSLIQV